jgi:MFS family permease
VTAVQILPTFLLGAWGGGLADRWAKRPLIFVTQSAQLVLAVLLGVLVFWTQVSPWHLLAVAAASGVIIAVDLPARLAFVIDMVGREDLPNAVALNALQFNVARAVGPALGAWVLGWAGPGWCFLLNGLSFVAVLAALVDMNLPAPAAPPVRRQMDSVLAGFHHLAARPSLLLLLVLTGVLSLFGWPLPSLLPALADRQLHGAEGAYGSMLSAFGAGSLVAALLTASFGSASRSTWFLGLGVVLALAGVVGLAGAHQLHPAVACCAIFGCGLVLFFITAQSVMQLGATDENRGRVMGVWSMVTCGALPLGNVLAGFAAARWGVAPVLAFQGLGIAAAGIGVVVLARAGQHHPSRPK